MSASAAFCCNCKEGFSIGPTGAAPRMGYLKPLAEYSPRIKHAFAIWLEHGDGSYLCGNCYYDLLDAEDEA